MILGSVLLILIAVGPAAATTVTIETPLGAFSVRLFDDVAPNTVANFLDYVNSGGYEGTFVHRSVPGFVIQGGGFRFDGANPVAIETNPPVANEFQRPNLRGTIAMAKQAEDPDSATSQWFINLTDNPDLDTQNGGFTVFGEVVGDGMQVVDGIAALPRFNFGSPFESLPLIDFEGAPVQEENLVLTSVSVRPEGSFEANEGLSGTWFDPDTAGQGFLMDLFPAGEALQIFVAWFTYAQSEPDPGEVSTFGTIQHRWFTASGEVDGNLAELTITANRGGVFNDARETSSGPVGTMAIEFRDCTSASLSFAFDGGPSDTIDIVRLTPDVFCETLATTGR